MRYMIGKKLTQVLAAGILAVSGASLTGCSLDTPTAFTQKKVEVIEDTRVLEETAILDEDALRVIADQYMSSGHGPIDITVTYNPASKTNTARKASEQAARVAQILKRNSVTDVETEILPVHNDQSLTVISYTYYTAQAPSGCGFLENISDEDLQDYKDYRIGCSTETYLAQQIARPKDLVGENEIEEDLDGRKQANVLGAYKVRLQNPRIRAEATN